MLDDDEELLLHETEGIEIEDEDGESAEIKAEDTSAVQRRYEVKGEPDFFHHKRVIPMSLSELGPQKVINDWALSRQKPIPFFGRAIKKVSDRFSDFAVKSGYTRKTNRFEEQVLLHRPLHAMTEGGKGLTQNTRPVVMAHAGMSDVNNIIFGHGCFPLESDVNTVLTPDGDISLGKILREGLITSVVTEDGRFVKIEEIFDNGEKEVFEFEDEDGNIYVCTEDHPFHTMVKGELVEIEIGEAFEGCIPILIKS